jgi:hypothetical protein
VRLVDPLGLNAEGFRRRVDHALAFAAEGIGGAPDGNADFDFVVRRKCGNGQTEHECQDYCQCQDLFHGFSFLSFFGR